MNIEASVVNKIILAVGAANSGGRCNSQPDKKVAPILEELDLPAGKAQEVYFRLEFDSMATSEPKPIIKVKTSNTVKRDHPLSPGMSNLP